MAGFACKWKGSDQMTDTKKRSVVFPKDVSLVLDQEAKRQGISFNKVVVQTCMEKYPPESYSSEIANQAEGGLRETDYAGDTDNLHMEVRIAGEDVIRLKRFAAEAGLSVKELIRRFARFGKVEVNEITIPGVEAFNEAAVPLMGELEYLIGRTDNLTGPPNTSFVVEMRNLAEKLLQELRQMRKQFYYAKKRISRKLREREE